MTSVYICGVGMTRFGKYPDLSLKELARTPLDNALSDAGVSRADLQAAYVGNSMAGIVTGQESIRGQTILSANGIASLPIVNVENACATGATALQQAYMAIRAGAYDVVLVLGVEKLFHTSREVSYRALASATDIEVTAAGGSSVFLEESSRRLESYMQNAGATIEHVARIAAKNHRHGSLNPLAQYQHPYTVQEILDAPVVAAPLTRLMSSPIGDGAAAAIPCSDSYARKISRTQIRIAASVLRSAGTVETSREDGLAQAAQLAYEMAGLGPDELSVAEVHDTSSASELMLYEPLGFCARGDAVSFIESGDNALGGRMPVNTSGGLVARGHPVGATGVAQIFELTQQLRGQAGARQVERARTALAHNAGGTLNGQPAASCLHILVADAA